ncbi:tetratricopeptide repeat protein [Neobacillus niacini]|uniref:tetratricopeptide repeat protein n=1 Tax=Neobacillus niacini TaxID=86668 RepID=UPI003983AB3C
MSLRDKTIEELEEIEEEINEQEREHGYLNYSIKIDLYREMYRKLSQFVRQNGEDYQSSLDYVKRKLVYNLIYYGTYLKTEYQKDDYLARSCLEEALQYDQKNPLAAYRLGFLSYKFNDYIKAIHYFQTALDHDQYHKQHLYHLNEQQQFNAHLYLTNCSLHLAKDTYEKMNQLPFAKIQDIPNEELSPLFNRLLENEKYMLQNAFYKISKDVTDTCSKAECEQLISSPPPNTLLLYFSDRNITALFNGQEVSLTQDQGYMLSYFLIKSSEQYPATRHHFSVVDTIRPNTYIQSVNRLRNRLSNQGFPAFIQRTRFQEEAAYYYDENYPFMVMYRVDEEIEYR